MSHAASPDRSASGGQSSISSTLLERVKDRRPDAWQRLVDLFGPVVYRWCRQSGLGPEDAADVVQEVFAAVATHVADFRRQDGRDSFTAWLATITRNKVRDHFRRRQGRPVARGGSDSQQLMLQVPEPAEASSLDQSSLAADRGNIERLLSRRALDLVRSEFENRTWEAFWRAAVEGHRPADIAADLGMTVCAVYKSKSRVLRRLRQELRELLE